MKKIEDKETRYYIDLDLKTGKIIGWDFNQRETIEQHLSNPFHQRVFITKGQYNNIVKKHFDLSKSSE